MLYGHWEATVDYKWRLRIPSELSKKFLKFVLIRKNESGFLEITELNQGVEKKDLPDCYELKKGARVLIPRHLRKSISFLFGKKVFLIGKGKSIEIKPRR